MSTSTQDVKPDPGAAPRDHERQHGLSGLRRIALAAAAVALCLIAGLMIIQSRDDAPATNQAAVAADARETTMNASAEEVATGFLGAFGSFDVKRAMTYLADDATISSLGGQDDPRLLIAYLEATGYQQILDPCRGLGSSDSGTSVRCTFAFHALRSGELGRGPFGGSYFDLIVREGEIVHVSQHWETAKFSPRAWEPFASWVSEAHPEDAAVMYTDDSHSNVRLTEQSIGLWERRTRQYADDAGR